VVESIFSCSFFSRKRGAGLVMNSKERINLPNNHLINVITVSI
jgi:hypothetical protein